MKKIILSLTAAAMITGALGIVTTAKADSAYNTTLALIRQQKIDNLVKRIDDLAKRTQIYILQTGDTNPTLSKIDSYYSLPETVWKDYDGSVLQMQVKNNQVAVSNIFIKKEPDTIVSLFQNDPYWSSEAIVNTDSVSIPLSATTIVFMNKVNELKKVSGVYIGISTPPETATKWYKPDGKGGLILYIKQGTKWQLVGESGNGSVVVDSTDDLNSIPAPVLGQKAFVKTSDGLQEYMWDGSKWEAVTGEQSDSGGFSFTKPQYGTPKNVIYLNTTYGAANMDDLAAAAIKKKTGKSELLNGWYEFNGGKIVYIDWNNLKYFFNGHQVCINGKCYNAVSVNKIDKTKPNLVFHTWITNYKCGYKSTTTPLLLENVGTYYNGKFNNILKKELVYSGGNTLGLLGPAGYKYYHFYAAGYYYCYAEYYQFPNKSLIYQLNNCSRTDAYQIPAESASTGYYYGPGIAYRLQ